MKNLVVSIMGLLIFTPCVAETVYVDADATGANNGSSWVDAYICLQDALTAARYLAKPVEIWVAEGTYRPDQGLGFTPGDRTATFELMSAVTLKGGYAGYGQPDPNACDITRYETILSGDLNGDDADVNDPCDLLNEPTHAENSYHVVTGEFVDGTAVLEGFTISHANDSHYLGLVAIVPEDASKRATIPTADVSDLWKSDLRYFDDSDWLVGTGSPGGVGYDARPDYRHLISLDVGEQMAGKSTSCYIRVPFVIDDDPARFRYMALRIRYDDGFVAYVNGVEVARSNFTGTPAWDSHASDNRDEALAVVLEEMDISRYISVLQPGENLLAIHGMNAQAGSSDFLISAELVAGKRCFGGGMHNYRSSPTVTKCTFMLNSADEFGGGMGNRTASPTVTDCTFYSNSAGDGGGVYNDANSEPVLTGCIFNSNSAAAGGGAYNNKCRPSFIGCTFSSNSADQGGGAYNNYARPTLTQCMLSGNSASLCGGGMCDYLSNPTLTGCTFRANETAGYGAGMFNYTSSPILTNCVFSGNLSDEDGGGMLNYKSSPILVNCIFAGNTAPGYGGGMFNFQDSNPTLTNCTFTENRVCGMRDLYSCHPMLVNCILWGNIPGDITSAKAVYSNVQGGKPGEGNINADPCFAEPGYWVDINDPSIRVEPDDPNALWVEGDYHLKSQAGRWDANSQDWARDDVTSPCIDAGSPMSPIGNEPFPNGGIVNMGAYGGSREASKSYLGEPICETVVPGDIDGDCKIDTRDVRLMVLHWLEDNPTVPVCETIVAGDINDDCKIDLEDFALMASHWLEDNNP